MQMLPCQETAVHSGVVQQEMVCQELISFACFLFGLVDFQLLHVHNTAEKDRGSH